MAGFYVCLSLNVWVWLKVEYVAGALFGLGVS